MKLTFPHMGTLYIPVRALFTEMGLEVVVPPPSTQRTLSLGTRYAPEFACLPLKVNLGNFIEALEQGADTVVMAGGVGPCRFGYYGEIQREILHDLGYRQEMLILEPPRGHFSELLEKLRKLKGNATPRQILGAISTAWTKICAVDDLERLALRLRPREAQQGETTRRLQEALVRLDDAAGVTESKRAWREGRASLEGMALRPDEEGEPPLRVAVLGEIYVVLEPFVNMQVETRLGEMGVEVERTIYLKEWIQTNLFLDVLRINGRRRVEKLARPYLEHFVGGHGIESVAHTVELGKRGFDGVIHLAPFTCMPEIVASSILPRVSAAEGIPVLNLVVDEHTGEAGVVTRLEAFVDMLRSRRRRRARENVAAAGERERALAGFP